MMLLNKIDLLPYLNFDVQACIDYARRVNPNIQVIQVSAQSGQGMEDWIEWLSTQRADLLTKKKQALAQQLSALDEALAR